MPACGWIGASPGVQHPGVTPSFDMRSPIPTASWTRRLSSHLTRPYTPATPGIPPKFEWLTRLNAVTASAIFPCSCPRDATVMAIASLMGVGVSGINSRIRTASVGGVGVAMGGVGGVGLVGLLVPPPHAVTNAIMTSSQNVSGERWIAIGRQSTALPDGSKQTGLGIRRPVGRSDHRRDVVAGVVGMGDGARGNSRLDGEARTGNPRLRRHWVENSRTREKRPQPVRFAGFARASALAEKCWYRTRRSTAEIFQFLTLSRSIYSSTATKVEIGWEAGIRNPSRRAEHVARLPERPAEQATTELKTRELAGRQGFEPRYRGPEPRVLPLDDLPVPAWHASGDGKPRV